MATGTDRDNPELPASPTIWRRFLTRLGFRFTGAQPEDAGLVPPSRYDPATTATKFFREDGIWETPAGSSGGITELTTDVIAGPGSGPQAATIATDAVTTAKIADDAVTTAKIPDDAVTTAKVADSNVTYAKIQNVSANSKLIGSGQTGSGSAPEEISLGSDFSMVGTTLGVPQVAANQILIGVNAASITTNAANIAKRIMRCSFHVDANSSVNVTSTSLTFLSGNDRNIQIVDLSAYTHVRLSHRTVTRNTSDDSRLVVQYVTTYSQTASNYINMGVGDTPPEVASQLTAYNLQTSGWVALNSNAQVDDVYLAVMQMVGDGVTARAASVTVEFR